MENFSSLFEFLAALNSAYIVSNHFLESLVSRFNWRFITVQEKLKAVESYHKQNHDAIVNAVPKVNATKELKELFDGSTALLNEIAKLQDSIDENKKKRGMSFNFNYMCLFGALYSVVILILIGLEFNFCSTNSGITFFITNVLCILFIIIFFLVKSVREHFSTNMNVPNYDVTFIGFMVCCLPLVVGYFIDMSIQPIEFLYHLKVINLPIALIIPTGHFIYYFFKSKTNSKKDSKDLETALDKVQRECTEFAGKIKHLLGLDKKAPAANSVQSKPTISSTSTTSKSTPKTNPRSTGRGKK